MTHKNVAITHWIGMHRDLTHWDGTHWNVQSKMREESTQEERDVANPCMAVQRFFEL